MLLKNGKVFLPHGLSDVDILVEGGRIREIGHGLKGRGINLHGKLILPGIIDVHVHFRDPGATNKEDFVSGSSAALAGGITTVFDQPNTSPQPADAKRIRQKIKDAKKKSLVNFNINAGVGANNISKLRELRRSTRYFGEIFMCESVGDIIISDTADFYNALHILSQTKAFPTIHAENQQINDYFKKKLARKMDPDVHCDARPSVSEVESIARALAVTVGPIHFCHISTGAGLGLIKQARATGRSVSCEVTPHHLFLSRDDMKELGSRGKMNPPLRSPYDVAMLWNGIHDGSIDMVATDHAPHLLEEKDQDIWAAPGGVPGVETMAPLLLNEVSRGNLALSRFVELTSEMPARIFGISRKGLIAPGYDADFTVVDMKKQWTVRNNRLETKCQWSPWDGKRLKGKPVMTIIGGNIAMRDGEIHAPDKVQCLNETLK